MLYHTLATCVPYPLSPFLPYCPVSFFYAPSNLFFPSILHDVNDDVFNGCCCRSHCAFQKHLLDIIDVNCEEEGKGRHDALTPRRTWSLGVDFKTDKKTQPMFAVNFHDFV